MQLITILEKMIGKTETIINAFLGYIPTLSLPAAAAAKSFQLCPTLCDPRDGSPPVPGGLKARTQEWVAISFSNA